MLNIYKYYDDPKELTPIGEPLEERDGGVVLGIFNNKEIILSSKETDKKLKWTDAVNYCKGLVYNGYNDWRLPDREELNFIYRRVPIVWILPEYRLLDTYYWSSTENGFEAWGQYLTDGDQDSFSKYDTAFVRAIRTQKVIE